MTTREFYFLIFTICSIFVSIVFVYDNVNNKKNTDQEIKKLYNENQTLIKKEEQLIKSIKEDSIIIADLRKKRSDVKTKRINREKDFNKKLDVIASTDSITDLLIGADIIRESHKNRLSYR